jgi:hypothetical protein
MYAQNFSCQLNFQHLLYKPLLQAHQTKEKLERDKVAGFSTSPSLI